MIIYNYEGSSHKCGKKGLIYSIISLSRFGVLHDLDFVFLVISFYFVHDICAIRVNSHYFPIIGDKLINPTETNSSHLKMDGWNTSFPLGLPIFRGYVSFREGKSPLFTTIWEMFFGFTISRHRSQANPRQFFPWISQTKVYNLLRNCPPHN